MMVLADSCTAVIVNFQTPDLTVKACRSLRKFYPGLPLVVIDNGSRDNSRALLESLRTPGDVALRLMFNNSNINHGPAMDMAARSVATPYTLFLDSDCEIFRGGFLEQMIGLLEHSPRNYVVGKRIFMDKRGFDLPEQPGAIPYVRPVCMLLRQSLYLSLPPFRHHGAPCLDNMQEASRRGLALLDFPVSDYVNHKGRGTAARYGYGLGLKGKLNHLLHKLGL